MPLRRIKRGMEKHAFKKALKTRAEREELLKHLNKMPTAAEKVAGFKKNSTRLGELDEAIKKSKIAQSEADNKVREFERLKAEAKAAKQLGKWFAWSPEHYQKKVDKWKGKLASARTQETALNRKKTDLLNSFDRQASGQRTNVKEALKAKLDLSKAESRKRFYAIKNKLPEVRARITALVPNVKTKVGETRHSYARDARTDPQAAEMVERIDKLVKDIDLLVPQIQKTRNWYLIPELESTLEFLNSRTIVKGIDIETARQRIEGLYAMVPERGIAIERSLINNRLRRAEKFSKSKDKAYAAMKIAAPQLKPIANAFNKMAREAKTAREAKALALETEALHRDFAAGRYKEYVRALVSRVEPQMSASQVNRVKKALQKDLAKKVPYLKGKVTGVDRKALIDDMGLRLRVPAAGTTLADYFVTAVKLGELMRVIKKDMPLADLQAHTHTITL